MDPEAFQHAKLILLWGSNPLTSHHHIWKFISAARAQGAHLVVIDPVRTRSARQADEHLAPRPGTDAALALGLMHEVVRRGAHDEAFLRERCVGWDAYRERLAEFPPERVAEICDLPVERIVALGERLATTRPTAIRATMGIQRHAGGGMTLRTLATIPAVTGDWALPGGGLAYSTSGYFRGDRAGLARDDLRPQPVRSLLMTRIGDVLLDADPAVHALVVYGANPLASNPDSGKVRRALAREDLFTVVIEQVPTDTADYADIVLPSTMQTEHLDVHDGYGHMYLAWNEPAVEPPGECLPHTEIFRRLARAMGLEEPALYDDDLTLARTLVESGHPTLSGVTVERLRREGWVRLGHPHPLVPFQSGFPTPSGKLELYSERAAADGHDPLPGYTPPAEAADAGRRPPRADRRRVALVPQLDVRQRARAAAPRGRADRRAAPRRRRRARTGRRRPRAGRQRARQLRGAPGGRRRGPARRRRHDEGPLAQAAGRRGEHQRGDRGARRRPRRRRRLPRLRGLGPRRGPGNGPPGRRRAGGVACPTCVRHSWRASSPPPHSS